MFRILAATAFAVLAVVIVLHYVLYRCRCRPRTDEPAGSICTAVLRKLVYLLTLLLLPQRLSLLGKFRKLLYLLALLCFAVLAVTGFYPALVLREELSGYLLMVHVSAGGAFAACLALLALMWADHCRFDGTDWQRLTGLFRRTARPTTETPPARLCQKLVFWIILVAALPLILSVVLSMFPLLGTEGQLLLAEVHRYCAVAFTVLGVWYIYLLGILSGHGIK